MPSVRQCPEAHTRQEKEAILLGRLSPALVARASGAGSKCPDGRLCFLREGVCDGSRAEILVLHGKLGYGGKGSNDEEEVIIIPIAVANPLSDFDFVVEALELAGADRERSM